jgi:hypothetical protein
MAKAKTMTVARLYKQLGAMIQNGQGWMKVAVNKRSFHHPLEGDGAVILNAESASHKWVPLTNDDGGAALRKDGTERGSMRFVIDGGREAF